MVTNASGPRCLSLVLCSLGTGFDRTFGVERDSKSRHGQWQPTSAFS